MEEGNFKGKRVFKGKKVKKGWGLYKGRVKKQRSAAEGKANEE